MGNCYKRKCKSCDTLIPKCDLIQGLCSTCYEQQQIENAKVENEIIPPEE